MMMRYYWGFAISHIYAHNWQSATSSSQGLTEDNNNNNNPSLNLNHPEEPNTNTGDELEFSLENLEDDVPAEDDDVAEEDNPAASHPGDINPDDYCDMYT